MQKIDGEKLQLIVPEEMISRIQRVGERLHLTRSETMRNMMDVGLTIFEDFEKVGIIRFAEIIGKTKKALRREVGQQSLFDKG